MRWAAKRDDTEAGIVKALEAHGWTVFRLSDKGVPDLLAIKNGRVQPFECKSPGGKLTPAQEAAFERWLRAGMPVCVVTTPEEALAAVAVPVEGVLEPLKPIPVLSAEAHRAYVRDVLEPEMHRLMSPSPGHVVTPAYQRAQTDAVVPPERRFICRDCPWRGDDQDAASTHAKVKDHAVDRAKRRKPTPPPSVPPLKEES